MEWVGGWGGNRWYATLRGTSAAMGGEGGGVGADKWRWEGGLFPKVPAGMTRRGTSMWVCLHVCMSVPACACVKEEPYSDFSFSSSEVRSLCLSVSCPLCLSVCGEVSDDSPRASKQLVHRHQDCMKMMLKLLITQLLWLTTNCDLHVRRYKSASSKTAICEGNLIALIWFLCFFIQSCISCTESCWAEGSKFETYPQCPASLLIITPLFYNTYAWTDGTHAHTHAHTNPQLQWLPVNTPASVVYMVLPIEQMLWNLRCKSTPPPPLYLIHTHIHTHANPHHLPPPPAGPAMNMPCGAPFPLALRLWLCQLCCVWPPPTGKTKKTADSKWTISLCVCLCLCVHAEVQDCAKLELSVILTVIYVKLRRKEPDIIFSSVKNCAVELCRRWEYVHVYVWVVIPFVCLCRCTVYAVCTACHIVSPYMLVVNPLGNSGGIPVTMEMFKLICNKISTWERLIQGKVLIYSSWWIQMHFLIRSDVDCDGCPFADWFSFFKPCHWWDVAAAAAVVLFYLHHRIS